MRFLPLIVLLGVLAAAPTEATAKPADGWSDRIVVAQNGGKSLAEAVEQVRRRTNGQIVSAETRVRNGREVHHIKVLTKDGKVKTHKVQGRRVNNGR